MTVDPDGGGGGISLLPEIEGSAPLLLCSAVLCCFRSKTKHHSLNSSSSFLRALDCACPELTPLPQGASQNPFCETGVCSAPSMPPHRLVLSELSPSAPATRCPVRLQQTGTKPSHMLLPAGTGTPELVATELGSIGLRYYTTAQCYVPALVLTQGTRYYQHKLQRRRQDGLVPQVSCTVLRAPYALSGTNAGYCATRRDREPAPMEPASTDQTAPFSFPRRRYRPTRVLCQVRYWRLRVVLTGRMAYARPGPDLPVRSYQKVEGSTCGRAFG